MAEVYGLHHVTAICGSLSAALPFYRNVLGLRFVKKTVNFDDPESYHLYFGDEVGSPGSALTFFVWEHLPRARHGRGEAGEIAFAVPLESLPFWQQRLAAFGVRAELDERFGERRLTFTDPDGLSLALVEPAADDARPGWTGGGIDGNHAIRGFHGITLRLGDPAAMASVLCGLLDYAAPTEEGTRLRFAAPAGSRARYVDVQAEPGTPGARQGIGAVHHVAVSVADDPAHQRVQARIAAAGFGVTPVIDRDYFRSIYFRAPGGVLFEVATDGPGFTIDEPKARLGQRLCLPRQHAHLRSHLEATLPPID
ncbi:MAG: ring-cleaving dioxygenase [Geminicoccaceae bacterium]|nr:MAG: ring-cleaving dioxygenase [Geminicoccaceae bacterium]